MLKADDSLNRVYISPERNAGASLFIAFFRTQRYGQSPHSPKNCMPGAGWQPMEDTKISIAIPGRDTPIVINKYVIAHGDEQSVVLYWYQSHNRVIAGEYSAKFWLVADAIRYSRSDTALVRVIVPVAGQPRRRGKHRCTGSCKPSIRTSSASFRISFTRQPLCCPRQESLDV